MIRKTLIATSAAIVLAVTTALPAAAGPGPDHERLDSKGWFCFGHSTLAIHCIKDRKAANLGEVVSVPVLSWDARTGEFLGTELLIREDRYNGQPCPQDELHEPFGDGDSGTYVYVPELAQQIPYYVCHHFDTPLT